MTGQTELESRNRIVLTGKRESILYVCHTCVNLRNIVPGERDGACDLWFSTSMSGSSLLPVTPALGGQVASSGICQPLHTCVHTHMSTHTRAYTNLKKIPQTPPHGVGETRYSMAHVFIYLNF